jgi:hypothetical protein
VRRAPAEVLLNPESSIRPFVRAVARMGLLETVPWPAPGTGRVPSPDGPKGLAPAASANAGIGSPPRRLGGT